MRSDNDRSSRQMSGNDLDSAQSGFDPTANPPKQRRLKVWRMRGNVNCSVVGTCLSDGDLEAVLARCGLQRDPSMRNYDLHGYFAKAIGGDCAVARSVQKLLDNRHEGMVRKVGRIADASELAGLWDREVAAGRVPGAYWAFMTWDHIPVDLHARVFGEVHMLSHLMGRTAQAAASRLSELEATISALEVRLSRMRLQHDDALRDRDRQILALQDRLLTKQPADGTSAPSPRRFADRRARAEEKRDRALIAARQRARTAEAQVATLQSRLACVQRAARLAAPADALPERRTLPHRASHEEKFIRVLYVGGLTRGIQKLRDAAFEEKAELVHHDGGVEEAVARIDELLDRCHAVFCPIDCVSHSACIRAKQLCRKHGKAFVPLRSAGVTSFRRALAGLRAGAQAIMSG